MVSTMCVLISVGYRPKIRDLPKKFVQYQWPKRASMFRLPRNTRRIGTSSSWTR